MNIAPGANLEEASLEEANLEGANLQGANLRRATICWANLQGANLRRANLYWANLQGANLEGANLEEASLQGANLQGADIRGTIFPDYDRLPSTGPFICYKKVSDQMVLTLFVPHDAARTSCLESRKCRVDRALIVAATPAFVLNNKTTTGHLPPKYNTRGPWHSLKRHDHIYRMGEWTSADDYNDDIRISCTNGIHVFKTMEEAAEFCL